jgi:hypothetical protein
MAFGSPGTLKKTAIFATYIQQSIRNKTA